MEQPLEGPEPGTLHSKSRLKNIQHPEEWGRLGLLGGEGEPTL